MEWQPIETAPKDGTEILLYRRGVSQGKWRVGMLNGQCAWGGDGWFYPRWDQPTHWMPLPEAPNA